MEIKKCACSSVDRVPGYEPVGRGFESPQARQAGLGANLRSKFFYFQSRCPRQSRYLFSSHLQIGFERNSHSVSFLFEQRCPR